MDGKRALGVLSRMLIQPRRPRPKPTRMVAIVVPLSLRAGLLAEEEVSLRHLVHFLGRYDKYLVAPRGQAVRLEGFTTLEFSRKYFGSMAAYNRLMYLPSLYELFQDYRYILMYHLDALVFSDQLVAWCETDVDYIGAPWFPCGDLPWAKEPAVGNGGFALMKVETILEVLYRRYEREPLRFWKDWLVRNLAGPVQRWEHGRGERASGVLARNLLRLWNRVQATETQTVLNDIFWGYHARRFVPEFKVPDWKTALRFAFEASPRQCLEWTGGALPFGCHAWPKYDRGFWESYLLPAEPPANGTQIPGTRLESGRTAPAGLQSKLSMTARTRTRSDESK